MRSLNLEDESWVRRLWFPELGAPDTFSGCWWRLWNGQAPNQYWVGVEGEGFVAFTLRKDGGRTVNYISVAEACRGSGLALRLLEFVGSPCTVVTDTENAASNRLYQKAGFRKVGIKEKSDGGKVNVWQRF